MAKEIKSLTKEQEAKFPEYVEKWTKIGLCTDPVDRPKAEAAIAKCYEKGGLKPPKEIVWSDSPMASAKARAERMWGELKKKPKDKKKFIQGTIRDSLSASCFGAHDAGWLSFYDFFRTECGLTEETERLEGLTEYAKLGGWMIPHTNTCFASERHNVLHRDERGRAHCPDGMAIGYPDGWGVYLYHGVRVPKWVIMEPLKITPKKIDEEQNAEVRRVMVERYGVDKYIIDGGAEIVHEDEFGVLYRKDMGSSEPIQMVKVIDATPMPDGTRKTYFLGVPPDMVRVKQAIAWGFDMAEEDYMPTIQT